MEAEQAALFDVYGGIHSLLPTCALLALLFAGCTPAEAVGAAAGQPPQAAAPAAPNSSVAERQHVRVLIAQVEAAYAAGDADYRKGLLAEAKVEFDRAVDLMLSSGLDIKSRPAAAGRIRQDRRPG